MLQTCKCQWAYLSMRVAIKGSIDLFKSDGNRFQHRVNIKPIHVKIEWISIQNRSDINLKWSKIDLKIINSCSWSEHISAQNRSDINLNWSKNHLKNNSKSVLGAMLAQDDTCLEPSWPKMSPRIDFSLFLIHFGGPKCTRNRFKNQAIFRHP